MKEKDWNDFEFCPTCGAYFDCEHEPTPGPWHTPKGEWKYVDLQDRMMEQLLEELGY